MNSRKKIFFTFPIFVVTFLFFSSAEFGTIRNKVSSSSEPISDHRCKKFRQFLFLVTNITDVFLIEKPLLMQISDLGIDFNFCTNLSNKVSFALLNTTKLVDFSLNFAENLSKEWQMNTDSNISLQLISDLLTIEIFELKKTKYYWMIASKNNETISALLPIPLTRQSDNLSYIYVPADIKFFLWQLDRSRLLECNRTTAEVVKKIRFSRNMSLTPAIDEIQFRTMPLARDLLYESRKDGVLIGGSLLGWYRDCDIVADTTDFDFALKATEYDKKFEDKIVKDKRIQMYWILGRENDSLELSFYRNDVKVDIFLLYSLNSSNSYVSGMSVPTRQSLLYIFPVLSEICTAVIRFQLFFVPCNVKEFLLAEYGPEWHLPHFNNDYYFDRSAHNIHMGKVWSRGEWPKVCRSYLKTEALVASKCTISKRFG